MTAPGIKPANFRQLAQCKLHRKPTYLLLPFLSPCSQKRVTDYVLVEVTAFMNKTLNRYVTPSMKFLAHELNFELWRVGPELWIYRYLYLNNKTSEIFLA